ncbi:Hypothetical predicted protein, partial [Scomber scombrus]
HTTAHAVHIQNTSYHHSHTSHTHFRSSHFRVGETKAPAAILDRTQAKNTAAPDASPPLSSALLFIDELIQKCLLQKISIPSNANTTFTSCPEGSRQGQSGVEHRSPQGE